MNSPETSAPETRTVAVESDLIEQDDLVEEVSIDGMCGVY
jgi:mycofactocin precursor